MNTTRTTEKWRRIAIVGGGITGLAAAYTLQEKAHAAGLPVSFTLLESSSRLGGKIISEQVGGFLIEGGPDSFIQQKPWALDLARELGLESDLIGANPFARRVFVVNRGRLVPIPDGFSLITPTHFSSFIRSPLISWQGKLRMGRDLFLKPPKNEHDESIGQFVRRHYGREALDRIAEPLMAGIHVSDPEQQSLLATFPRLRESERRFGSLIRAAHAQRPAGNHASPNPSARTQTGASAWKESMFVSLRGGMGQLVQALEKKLEGSQVHKSSGVSSITPGQVEGYLVTTEDGRTIEADAVLLATPAYISAGLVRHFAPGLANELETIRYVSSATASLAYWSPSLGGAPLAGSGFIVPRSEKRRILAATISSIKFEQRAPQGYVLVRGFLGGAGREALADASPAEIIETVRGELAVLLGIQAKPVATRVYHWKKGNPQYDVGHLERVKSIQSQCSDLPGLFVAGSAFEGVGVPDCIHQGQQAAEKALAYVAATEVQLSETAYGK